MGGWTGLALGALAGVVLIAAFPVVIGVGVVGGGLLGAAVIGLGAASMVTGAAHLGGKIGQYVAKKFGGGGGGGGGGPPCSSIAVGSSKTVAQNKAVARIGDPTTHNAAPLKSGAAKVLEGGKPVSRVAESATCGASKVISGASKVIVGGPSVDSGAPNVADPDDAFFESVMEKLDTFSTWTGIAQIPMIMGAAVRTGVKVGLKKYAERAMLAPPGAAAPARLGFREAAKTAVTANIATSAGRQLAVQGARDVAAAAGSRMAATGIGQAAGRVASTRAGTATVSGVNAALKEGVPASAMIAAQQYGSEPAANALVEYTGMEKDLADIVVEGTMFGGPTAFAVRGSGSMKQQRADVRTAAESTSTGWGDLKTGNWREGIFGREMGGGPAGVRDGGTLREGPDGVYDARATPTGQDAGATPTGQRPPRDGGVLREGPDGVYTVGDPPAAGGGAGAGRAGDVPALPRPAEPQPQGARAADPPRLPAPEPSARADGGESSGGGGQTSEARTPAQLKEEAQARLAELDAKPVITPGELREYRAIQEAFAHDRAVMDRLYPPKPEPRPRPVEEPVAARPEAEAPDRSVNIFGGELTPTPTTTETARRVGARELETLLETGEVAPRGPWAPTPEGRAQQILQHLASPKSNTPIYSIRSTVEASAGTSGVGQLKNGAATIVFKPGVEVYDVAGAAAKNTSTVEARMAVEEREIQLANGYKLSDVDRIYDAKGNVIWSAADQGAKTPKKGEATARAEVAGEAKPAAAAQHGEGGAKPGENCATCGDGAPGSNSLPTNADTLGVPSTGGAQSAWTQPAAAPKAGPKKELELVPTGHEPVAPKPAAAAKDAPLEFTLEPMTPAKAADAGPARAPSTDGALEFERPAQKYEVKKSGDSGSSAGPRGEPAPDATWYHGTPGETALTRLDPNFARAGNLYGPGGYLAQNRVFSETYAQGGTVYSSVGTNFERPFNADRAFSRDEAKAYLQSVGMSPQQFRDWAGLRSKFGGDTIYKGMAEVAGGDKAKVNDALRAAGHDVIYFKDSQGNQLANSLKEVQLAVDVPNGASAPTARAAPTTPAEFFDGATFGRKVDKGYRVQRDENGRPVLSDPRKMGWDDHSIPHEEVAAMAAAGHLDGAAVLDTKVGADGDAVSRLKVPTEYAVKGDPSNIQKGYFEFIREPDGSINHAFFRYDPAFYDAHAAGAATAGAPHAKAPEAVNLTAKGTVGDGLTSNAKGAHAAPGQAGGGDCAVCSAAGDTKSAGGGALSDPGLTFPKGSGGDAAAAVKSTHALVPQKSRIGAAWDRVKSLFGRSETPAERVPEVPAVAPAPKDVFSVDDVPAQFRSTGTEPLYRGSRSSPEALKARGGFTRDGGTYNPTKLSLEEHVNPSATINAPDQWVSTSSNLDAAFHPMYSGHSGFVYDIGKAGGVDVNAVFGAPQHGIEKEFTFNSVEWAKIKGWRPVQEGPNYSRVLGDFVPNPDYTGP